MEPAIISCIKKIREAQSIVTMQLQTPLGYHMRHIGDLQW